MAVDLIYSMRREHPYDVADSGDFFFARSLPTALRVVPVMLRDRGALGAAKLLAKIALGRCHYFGLARQGRPLSTGVAALGYCRFYRVPSDAIVLGEIITDKNSRGRGHATHAIMLLINAVIRRGSMVFYIDTQTGNLPMIRAIEKLGFGPAIGGTGTL